MDFNPYELYTQTYTQKYSHLNTENSKKYLLWRDNDFFTTLIWQVLLCFETTENSRILEK